MKAKARLAFLVAVVAAFLVPVASATASPVSVTLTGSGAGVVTSANPSGINCSRSGGVTSGTCNIVVPDDFSFIPTDITVTPAPGSIFSWTAGGGSCTGTTTPCQLPLTTLFAPYNLSAKFSAVPNQPPAVTTDPASAGFANHLRTLEGRVNPRGFAVTDCHFVYGETTEYGESVPCNQSLASIGSGSTNVDVSASTDPLEPSTTYHFRLIASNELGSETGYGYVGQGEDLTFTTGSAPSDTCPNAAVRAEQGIRALTLPDCMALEQVSPQKKDNQDARIFFAHTSFGAGPVGGFSANGNRVLFTSQGTLAGSPSFNDYSGDSYIASRNADEQQWETSYTNPPSPLIRAWSAVPEAAALSPDLSHWFQIASTVSQYEAGLGQAFRGGLDGEFQTFSPFLTALSGNPEGANGNVTFESRGASADGSRLYFTADKTITYLSGDPTPAGSAAVENTYIAQPDSGGNPSLELLARDGLGKAWGGSCGTSVGGGQTPLDARRDRGGISADGSRTYFTTRPDQPASGECSVANGKRIMVREESPAGTEIRELFTSPPGAANDLYEGASFEGDKVYLTTARSLVASDLDGATDLYLYDAAQAPADRLTNVSGAGSATPSVATISGDGSHAYFNSTDVLTTDPGPEGKLAQAGQNNLYLYERSSAHPDGRIAFIAVTQAGSAYPVPVLGPDPNVLGVGGDGHRLLFTSSAALTADDTDGGFRDIFRYDAEDGTLGRVSTAAPGGSDNGAFDVFTGRALGDAAGLNAPNFVGFARWASEDGETVAFKTVEGLLPGDDNGITDSYAWHEGELARLPGTSDSLGLTEVSGLQDRPIVSPDGDAVAFQTYAKLLPRDGDTAVDVYVARVGGGFPEPPPAPICVPDGSEGCQGAAGTPPNASNASNTIAGRGNVVEPTEAKRKLCRKGKRRVIRAGKARCAPRKGQRNRNANTDRRAGK